MENISIFNPWYKNGDFLYGEARFNKRKVYYRAKEYLKKDLMFSIVGLRRTGKTTIIKQIISHLLAQKIAPEKIFFYEFDQENISLEKTLEFYFNNILREDLYSTKCYIFLDELQLIENWQDIVKKYYDINPKIKFIISGSTHLYLHKNTRESLAGRIIDIYLNPLSWHEFLEFKYEKKYDFVKDIFSDDFFDLVKSNADILLCKKDFLTFISYGEYPYFFHEKDMDILDEYYRNSILDKIFSKDINIFDINNHRAFFNLFQILSKDTAQEINLTNLSREVELDRLTVKRYIDILQKMFLYNFVYKHEKSLRKQLKSFKKGYSCSLNLLKSSLRTDFWNMENDQKGHIIETFIYNELIRNNIEDISFFNNTKIKKEVDFILKQNGKIIPVEVKAAPQIQNKHLKNLLYFAQKNNLRRAIVFYGGNEIEKKIVEGVDVEFFPYWVV